MNNSLHFILTIPAGDLWPELMFNLKRIMAWIRNYFHNLLWDIITHPCPYLNGSLTHWPLGDLTSLKLVNFKLNSTISQVFSAKLLSSECHNTSLIISQLWFW